ncbi:MAG: hypothetical protein E7260_07875 [Lachnospiraceae bacterium]|nr:hypothetical protein [Lachnospiraceae bacterium]
MAQGAGGMTYVRMMIDILEKKEAHLAKILEYTQEQETLLKAEEFDETAFVALVDKKEGLIKKIEEFDDGFQAVYNRMAEELAGQKEQYKDQILRLQALITSVTDLGVKLTALEQKNRSSMELRLRDKKQGIKQFRVSKQTADKYYKNMIGMQTGASYFMDQKK